MFRPLGVASWGSIPLMFVGFIAFLVVLRAVSLKLALVGNSNSEEKGNNMEIIKEKTPNIVTSSILETGWAIGVGSIAGQLVA